MKKILYITKEPLDNPRRGTPIRIYNIIKQISKEHEIILSSPEVEDGFTGSFYKYPEGNLIKKLSYFSNLIKKHEIEVVMTSTDIEITIPFFLKIFNKVKIVVELHGHYAEELYYQKLIGLTKRFLLKLRTNFILRFYDLIIVCSYKDKIYYEKINKNIKIIYEGLVVKNFLKLESKKNSVFTVGYAGNLQEYQGVNFLLKACQSLKSKDIFPFQLVLVSNSGPDHVERLLGQYDLKDITKTFHKVSQHEANNIMASADVLVIPRPSLMITEYGFPSKLSKDLMTGVPTITTNVGPVSSLLKGKDCCVIIDHVDIAKNVENGLIKVFNMSIEERSDMGKRAIDLVKKELDWDILGKKINKEIALI